MENTLRYLFDFLIERIAVAGGSVVSSYLTVFCGLFLNFNDGIVLD